MPQRVPHAVPTPALAQAPVPAPMMAEAPDLARPSSRATGPGTGRGAYYAAQEAARLKEPSLPEPSLAETAPLPGEEALSPLSALLKHMQERKALPRQAPEAIAAGEAEREKKLKLLRMLTGVTEGLGSFYAPTSGEIMLGIQRPQPMQATALRERAAEIRNQVSPAMRDALRAAGVDLPEGLDMTQLQAILPVLRHGAEAPERQMDTMLRLINAQGLAESRQAIQDRWLGSMEAQAAGRKAVADRFEIGKISAGALSAQQITRIWRDSQSAAQDVLRLVETDDPIATQAAFVRMARAAGDVGTLTNQDIARWTAYPGLQGLAQGIEKFVLSEWSPAVKASLKRTAQELEKLNRERIGAILEAKKQQVGGMLSGETMGERLESAFTPEAFTPMGAAPVAQGGMRDAIAPDGTEYEIPQETDLSLPEYKSWRWK